MKKIFKILSVAFTMALLGASSVSYAQDYIAIAKNGNVYDEANAKYITLNQNNEDVNVIVGMVFSTTEHTPGWYKIEYSPGLHAFIPEQIVSSNFNTVSPGTFSLVNNPGQKITVENNGGVWAANANGKTYKGVKSENILVFLDDSKKVAFSLVDLGNGPIAITYDNSVTKFF